MKKNTPHSGRTTKGTFAYILTGVLIALHLLFVCFLQSKVVIGGDGIFTYTLANTPYAYDYIDHMLKYFPDHNGWMDAEILSENYVVKDYDAFNYSSVYFHQRIDNHPLLYYSLVHTVCSLFLNSYSPAYTMAINLIFVLLMDLMIAMLFRKIYGNVYAVIPAFLFLTLLPVLQKLYTLPRMYMMLAFFGLWYLKLHYDLIQNRRWRKSWLFQMGICIFLGSQTHYYFYVYAACMTLFTLAFLFIKKERYLAMNYMLTGVCGIAASWILFPWVIWHIFFNQMQKHTSVNPWSLSKCGQYLQFLNEKLLNGHFLRAAVICLIIFLVISLCRIVKRRKVLAVHEGITDGCVPDDASAYEAHVGEFSLAVQPFRRILFISTLLCSLILFTLDESNWYYLTPIYLPFCIWMTMILLNAVQKLLNIIPKNTPVRTYAAYTAAASQRSNISAVTIRTQNPANSTVAFTYKHSWIAPLICTVIVCAVLGIMPTVETIHDRSASFASYQTFHQVAVINTGDDCIYVESTQDNLLAGNFLEFGDYDEWKKISIEEFEKDGITEEMLAGRDSTNAVIVYISTDADVPSDQYTLLASYGRRSVYLYNE